MKLSRSGATPKKWNVFIFLQFNFGSTSSTLSKKLFFKSHLAYYYIVVQKANNNTKFNKNYSFSFKSISINRYYCMAICVLIFRLVYLNFDNNTIIRRGIKICFLKALIMLWQNVLQNLKLARIFDDSSSNKSVIRIILCKLKNCIFLLLPSLWRTLEYNIPLGMISEYSIARCFIIVVYSFEMILLILKVIYHL